MFSRRGGRDQRVGLGILLLGYQLVSFGMDRIPPVTLIAIIGQVAVFLGFVPILDPKYNTYNLCVRADRIWWGHEWHRLIYPTIMHATDMHLYYNMVSLLWKGSRLERRLGSVKFAVILVLFGLLTNVTMVLLSVGLEEYLDFGDLHLMRQCALGFSGVLFALKVLSNHYSPYDHHRILGFIPIESRYACWAELLLIHILVPNSSFLGHLSGIFVGFGYLYTPLHNVIDAICDLFTGASNQSQQSRTNTNFGGGTWGAHSNNNYEQYTGGMSEEEQMRMAAERSMRDRQNYDARWRGGHAIPRTEPPPYPMS